MSTNHPGHDDLVGYMERTRLYYAALGYERPYRWAHFDDVPFVRPAKPLSQCRVGLITTASPDREPPPGEATHRKQVWSGETKEPPEKLHTEHLSWDKESTHTEDRESFLPVERLKELAAAGRIGEVAPHFHGVPTEYSQRLTIEDDAPEILRRCREDAIDIALLVPL